MEGAPIAAAARPGLSKPDLDSLLSRVGEIPFDSDRKRMTTVHRISPSSEPAPQPTISTAALQQIRSWALDLRRPFVAFTKGAADSPLWQGFFHTRALSGEEILLCLGLSSSIFSAVEIEKAIIRRRREGEGASLETWNPNLETFS